MKPMEESGSVRGITRRQFLGGALAGLLGLTGLYVYENRYKDLIVSVLHRKLSYLDLSEIDLYSFAGEFADEQGTFGMKGYFLALAYPVVGRFEFLNIRRESTEEFEEHVVSKFLLSTDFFRKKMDMTRPIQYVAYSNPYKQPCANPFAEFD